MTETLIIQTSILAGSIVTSGIVQWLYTRKAAQRTAEAEAKAKEWEIYKEQLEAEREHVRYKDERIAALLRAADEKEQRFVEQTQRLRETQARELAANEERIKMGIERSDALARLAEAEREIGALKLQLKDRECVKLRCIERDPPNEHTRKAIRQQQAKEQSNESE